MLTRQEFQLFEKLTGSINMLGVGLPALIKAVEGVNPGTNHQRQVAALRRQSEAVVSVDEIIVYIDKHLGNIGGHNSTRVESDLALAEIKRQLKVLRIDITG